MKIPKHDKKRLGQKS